MLVARNRVDWSLDGVQLPLARHAFEIRQTSISEANSGPSDQVLDRARDDDLPRPGLGGDPRSKMNRDPADLSVEELAFARMKASADLGSRAA